MLYIKHGDSEVVNFQPIPFMVTGFSLILMMMGLFRNDVFLNIATWGPIMVFNFGVFIQVWSIEYYHQLSVQLDSIVLSRFTIKNDEQRGAESILTIFLFLFGLLLIGFSVQAIQTSSSTTFAIILFTVAIIFGLFVGRIQSVIQAGASPVKEHEKVWLMLDQESKTRTYADMDLWLRGMECKSRNEHQQKVESQSMQFSEGMKALLEVESTRTDLYRQLNYQIDLEKILTNFLYPYKQPWFQETVSFYSGKGNKVPKEKLLARVLLPALSELTASMSDVQNNQFSAATFDGCLKLIGKLAADLNNQNLFIPDSQESVEILSGLNNEDDNFQRMRFIQIVGYLATSIDSTRSWSPWWLLYIRYRLLLLMLHPDWNLIKPIENPKFTQSVMYGLSCVLTLGEELDADVKQIQQMVLSEIKRNGGFEYQKEPDSKFFKQLREAIVRADGLPIDTVIKMAWVLHISIGQE